MRRRNNVPLLFFFLLTTLFLANSQTNQSRSAPVASSEAAANPQSAPQSPPTGNVPPPASKWQGVAPNAAQNVSPAAQNPDSGDSGGFGFRKQVDEVVLHATVVDDKQRIVTSLDKGDFNVYENGSPQTITSFRHEEIPVAMGMGGKTAGPMRESRKRVNAAALNLVRASNSNDEVFIVNFNDEYYLDQDFTSNIN